MDLRLSPGGDLLLDEGRLGLTTGADDVRQRLELSLSLSAGEYFRDASEGVAYQDFLVGLKQPDLSIVRAALRGEALRIEGVASAEFDVAVDAERVASVSVEAVTNEGVRVEAPVLVVQGVG